MFVLFSFDVSHIESFRLLGFGGCIRFGYIFPRAGGERILLDTESCFVSAQSRRKPGLTQPPLCVDIGTRGWRHCAIFLRYYETSIYIGIRNTSVFEAGKSIHSLGFGCGLEEEKEISTS